MLLRGADAISGGSFLFAHRHLPTGPATVTEDQVWLTMLDLVENGRRVGLLAQVLLLIGAIAGLLVSILDGYETIGVLAAFALLGGYAIEHLTM